MFLIALSSQNLTEELVEFDRRRVGASPNIGPSKVKNLPFSIVPNRQLQHFTVQTDVRFLQENEKNILKWNWLPWIKPEVISPSEPDFR